MQKTSGFCNFISMFKAYKQCVTKPKVTTKVVIYPVFSTPISVNLEPRPNQSYEHDDMRPLQSAAGGVYETCGGIRQRGEDRTCKGRQGVRRK